MIAKYFGHLPTDQVQMFLSNIADVLLPGKPKSLKDEFVRSIEHSISNWMRNFGGCPDWIMDTQWGPTDARIRVAMINEGCTSLAEFAQKADWELLALPNFGYGSLKRLRRLTSGEEWRDPREERFLERMKKKRGQ